jgi:selenide,water dikinase
MTQTAATRTAESPLRLTHLSSCAGCAAKLPQKLLRDALQKLPHAADRRVLVSETTGDDAGVYKLSPALALVQTIDFFTPIVDDPRDFGRIAAANAISDVYAMGGKPLTAMNVLGFPAEKLPMSAVRQILRGGAQVARGAGIALLGGHTIRLPEPVYGLSVTGVVHPKRVLTNAAARPGDLLVLTKPLGTGIATTALKRDLASRNLLRRVVRSMTTLNTPGHDLAGLRLLRAATDVTGFGLLGHLHGMCLASGVSAEVTAHDLPVLSPELYDLIAKDAVPGGSRTNLIAAEEFTQWPATEHADRVLLADAQTSGGLLLAVPPRQLTRVRAVLERHRTLAAAVIGRITRGSAGRISVH